MKMTMKIRAGGNKAISLKRRVMILKCGKKDQLLCAEVATHYCQCII